MTAPTSAGVKASVVPGHPGDTTGGDAVAPPVFASLVGQAHAIPIWRAIVADAARARRGEVAPGFTHAWLITGPPGSGRSTAALALAAALTCPAGGCARCPVCEAILTRRDPDVEIMSPVGTTQRVADTRHLIARAASAPVAHPWRLVILEDADRLNDAAANALLRTLEEPTARTLWILCAPSAQDVLATLRSRCRTIALRTPATEAVAELLSGQAAFSQHPPVSAEVAQFAARAAMGHVGRARALALDEGERQRRQAVMRIPEVIGDLGEAMTAAAALISSCTEAAAELGDQAEAAERSAILTAHGATADARPRERTRAQRSASAQLKEVTRRGKDRRRRLLTDRLDRALLELTSFYRDVLVMHLGEPVALVNPEQRPAIERLAAASDLATCQRWLDDLARARWALTTNAAPQLTVEALLVQLSNRG